MLALVRLMKLENWSNNKEATIQNIIKNKNIILECPQSLGIPAILRIFERILDALKHILSQTEADLMKS